MKNVDFFIVGAPKCGTTAMYSYLKRHPQIYFPEVKEPHYFGSDLDFHGQSRITLKQYEDLYKNASANQILGDASVFYLLSEYAAVEIKKYNPEAKIIIMLRDPIVVMHSFHSQRLYVGTETIEDFIEALDAETDRKAGKRLPRHIGLRQGLYYRDVVRFDRQVERYLERFDNDHVHIVFYDDFSKDPRASYEAICNFLGITPELYFKFEPVNANKIVRYRWLRDVMKSKPKSFSRLYHILIPHTALRHSFSKLINKFNLVHKIRTPIPEDIMIKLRRELHESVTGLEKMTGKDLSSWKAQR
ncbi:hypothetical protein CKO25_20490 [Thiocapsa imhoffii]|uniref:Sulfotransferase domain-containing protein n=1 Tax=Thiocapsa imhoffii TaxID=382777 RepID=A0A9X0WLH1_9GAMM|nr:sulfotransferase [Thiocapsa imhoffii]MBK1646951.1 hypothetical protein [Thiocapsa imhoffii]